jgi:protein phosphatase
MSGALPIATALLAAGVGLAMIAFDRWRRAADSRLPGAAQAVGSLRPATALRRGVALPRLGPEDEAAPSSWSSARRLVERDCDPEEPSRDGARFELVASSASDRGARATNEDAVLVAHDAGLFAVADGMGGHEAGEIASRVAVERLAASFRDGSRSDAGSATAAALAERIVRAVEDAHRAVRDEADRRGARGDMGTTIVALVSSAHRRDACIAHVGDSRCYRARRGALSLLTADHTLGASGGPMGALLRRSVGFEASVRVDTHVVRVLGGDRFLLCSDGLSEALDDATIERVLSASATVDGAAAALVAEAKARAARDNVSVVVVDVLSAS